MRDWIPPKELQCNREGKGRKGASSRHFLVTGETRLVFYGNLHSHLFLQSFFLNQAAIYASLLQIVPCAQKPKTLLGALQGAVVRQRIRLTCRHKTQVTMTWVTTEQLRTHGSVKCGIYSEKDRSCSSQRCTQPSHAHHAGLSKVTWLVWQRE